MAHTEQMQAHCHRCQAPKRHTRVVDTYNHVPHLLASAFLCGLWLPLWFLSYLLHSCHPVDKWRCTTCGQVAGALTPEQRELRRIKADERRAVRAAERAESMQQLADDAAAGWRGANRGAAAAFRALDREARRLPDRIDHTARAVAGEGNDILYWFLVTIFPMLLGAAILTVAYLAR